MLFIEPLFPNLIVEKKIVIRCKPVNLSKIGELLTYHFKD
jgi:hypothetical protein